MSSPNTWGPLGYLTWVTNNAIGYGQGYGQVALLGLQTVLTNMPGFEHHQSALHHVEDFVFDPVEEV